MIAVDFFCGAGGLTRGLLDAGIDVVAGIDCDGRCRETYERNNAPAVFHQLDIRSLSPQVVRGLLGRVPRGDLLFAGCAPCQAFSQHRRNGLRRPDATLLTWFAGLVETVRPGHVLIENVPGLPKVRGFSAYRRFIKTLRLNGYRYAEGVIDAKHYGVPQTRRRYVLLASRSRTLRLPEKLCGPGHEPYRTVRMAIAHYPSISAGQSHAMFPNHEAANLSGLNLRRLRLTPHDGGDRRSWPRQLVLPCHRGDHNGHTDVYGRMYWDRAAPTLTGKCNSISNGRYGHPCQDRAISLREAASLQTFRDDYVFYGPSKHIAIQIGNAVPVRLAEVLGRQLLA